MSKWKISIGLLAAAVLVTNITVATFAASSSKQYTGQCMNGSPYTLIMSRSGDKVTSTLTVRDLPKSTKWNVNHAYTVINKVKNSMAKSNKSGTLTIKDTVTSSQQTTVFILVDEWNTAVGYCYVGGSI